MNQSKKNKKVATLYGVTFGISTIIYLMLFFCVLYTNIYNIFTITLLIISIILFIINAFVCIKVDHEIGCYICPFCSKKFNPSYKEMLLSMHLHKMMRLRCPSCNKKVWAKKSYEVINEKEKRN